MKPNGELKIEHDIPEPTRGSRKDHGYVQIAMRSMKKGDSVVIPVKSMGNVYTAAKKYIGQGKYTIRAVEGGGFRVWRIK